MPQYKIVRMYQNDEFPSQVIERCLTLEEAQAHCSDPETSSSTCTEYGPRKRTQEKGPWFDGYEST